MTGSYKLFLKKMSFPLVLILTLSSLAHGGVKWHPGHYFNPTLGTNKSAFTWIADKLYGEVENNPAMSGMQLRFVWSELEKSKDVYNFKEIDEHLKRLSTMGTKKKRLFLTIESRTFTTDEKLLPCYLTTKTCAGYSAIYEGGQFPYKKFAGGGYAGNSTRYWNTAVRDRFVKLIEALGARYNGHSHFEGISIGETAMGIPIAPLVITAAMEKAYYDNHLFIQKKMRAAFPNTITVQFTNYPREMLHTFVPALRDMGASLGGPDTFLDDEGLNIDEGPGFVGDGVYLWYPRLSGIVALTPSVMSQNYLKTQLTGPSRQPSVDELIDFTRDKLKATHVFWTRDKAEIYKKALARLKTLKANNSPRVKLNTACPSAYAPCITN